MNLGGVVSQIRGALLAEAERLVQRAADAGLEAAMLWSSGSQSLSDLRRQDHPYARRHGTPLLDPSRINVQSGQFRAAWESRGGGLQRSVVNESEVADYMKGTRSMVSRPIWERIEEAMLEAVPGAELD